MSSPSIEAICSHLGTNPHAPGPCLTATLRWDGPPPDAATLAALMDHVRAHRVMSAAVETSDTAPTDAAMAIARLAVLLQRAVGHRVADAPPPPRPDWVVVPTWDIDVGLLALHCAAALAGGRGLPAILDRFFDRVHPLEHSDCVMRILPAAERRGVPWSRLLPGATMIRLGQGIRQRVIDGSATPGIGATVRTISTLKNIATAVMRRHGLPVPQNRRVATLDEAVRAATEIGYPVVVKPNSTDLGKGITLDVRTAAALRDAYAVAARHGRVLIEEQLPGYNTRMMVMFGRFVSAVRKDPAQVVGDGRRTARELIIAENAARGGALKPIEIDDEAHAFLARQGLTIDAVPEAGRTVVLRHVSNFARGGSAHNVTALVHPDNARLAERAAAVIGLEVAGVDLVMPDITRSWREVGGGICELNAGPGIYMAERDTRIEDALIEGLFPNGATGRVPVVCVLAAEGAEAAGLVDRIAGHLGDGVAVVTPAGAHLGAWPMADAAMRTHDATQIALADPETRAIVLHLTPAALASDGLGIDRCDLAVVPSPAPADAMQLLTDHAETCIDPAAADRLAAALDRIVEAMARA